MANTMMQFELRGRYSMLALALFLCAGVVPQASAEGIYLCVDAQGRRELTDVGRKGCTAIHVPGALSAPIPAPRSAGGEPRARAGAPQPSVTPANFPRVDSAQQKARDSDRRDILNEELRSEERKLAEMRKEFNNGEPERQGNERNYAKYQERVGNMRDSIGRAEQNIQALRREISNIK